MVMDIFLTEETVVKGPEWRPVSDVRIVDPSPVSFLHDVAPANPEGIMEVWKMKTT